MRGGKQLRVGQPQLTAGCQQAAPAVHAACAPPPLVPYPAGQEVRRTRMPSVLRGGLTAQNASRGRQSVQQAVLSAGRPPAAGGPHGREAQRCTQQARRRARRRNHAEEVIGSRCSAVAQQQPCCLKVLNRGDGMQQAVMGLPFEHELVPHKRLRPQRRAQDLEALLVTGQCPVADPNRVTTDWPKVADVCRLLAGCVPDTCFGTI